MRSIYEDLYRVYCPKKEQRFVCTYCGLPAPTLDYVPALANVDYILCAGEKDNCDFLKVPCCLECNTLLSDELQFTITDRFYDLKYKLLEKYIKILQSEDWNNEELDELDYSLREFILKQEEFKIFIIKRIIYGFTNRNQARFLLKTNLF